MTVLGTALVRIDTDDKPFNSAIDRAQHKAQGFGSVLKGVGTVAGGFLAADAISRGFGALIGGFGKATSLASDLQEQMSKNRVVFGESSKIVEEFAARGAKSLGTSKVAVLEATGTFGNLLRITGLLPAETAKMSTAMVQLGTDMASFNNASPEETLIALRAGLSGETEPLRRFGVFLNEAAVEAEALSMGLGKSNVNITKVKGAQLDAAEAQKKYNLAVKEHGKDAFETKKALQDWEEAQDKVSKAMEGSKTKLTDAEKVQARYSLILKQTGVQQGDFARTADGMANKQRILAANWEDLQTKAGAALLPVRMFVVDTLLAGLPLLEQAAVKLAAFAAPIIAHVIPAFQMLKLGVDVFFKTLKDPDKTSDGFIGVVEQMASFIATTLIPAFKDGMAVLGTWLRNVAETARGIAEWIVQAGLLDAALLGLQTILEVIIPIAFNVAKAISDNKIAAMAFIAALGILIVAAAPVPVAIIAIITAIGLLRQNWDEIEAKTRAVWDSMPGIVKTAAELIIDVIMAHVEAIKTALDIGKDLFEIGAKIIQGFVDGAWSKVTAVTDVFGKIANAGKDIFNKAWDMRSPSRVAHKMAENIIDGFAQGLDKSWKVHIIGFFDRMHDAAIKKLGGIEAAVRRAAELAQSTQDPAHGGSYIKGSEGGGVAPLGSNPTANANARRAGQGLPPISGSGSGSTKQPNDAELARAGIYRGWPEGSAGARTASQGGNYPLGPYGGHYHMGRYIPLTAAGIAALRRAGVPGYVSGGMYSAGMPRIVGERGWEIDVPSTSGRVLSHEESKQALGATINIHNLSLPNVMNAQQLIRELEKLQTDKLRFARAGA